MRSSLRALKVEPKDRAAAELAISYARLVDDMPAMIIKVGPLLLSVLESLLLTPRARAALVKGATGDQGKQHSPLDELRSRRNKRVG